MHRSAVRRDLAPWAAARRPSRERRFPGDGSVGSMRCRAVATELESYLPTMLGVQEYPTKYGQSSS